VRSLCTILQTQSQVKFRFPTGFARTDRLCGRCRVAGTRQGSELPCWFRTCNAISVRVFSSQHLGTDCGLRSHKVSVMVW
jgi:hypothetical protein